MNLPEIADFLVHRHAFVPVPDTIGGAVFERADEAGAIAMRCWVSADVIELSADVNGDGATRYFRRYERTPLSALESAFEDLVPASHRMYLDAMDRTERIPRQMWRVA